MTKYLDTDGLTLYDSNIKNYFDNIVDTEIAPAIDAKANTADLAAVTFSGDYNDLIKKPNIFPFTVLTSDTTLPDDIAVNTMKFYLVNNSSTISITMPGDSSRSYVILCWNVIAAALVAAGKNPHYETKVGGESLSLSWTSSAEPYMLISVMRLS